MNGPDAYERLVDQLLASPHFGERMARLEWLDAARYADTNGFSIDGGRHMWLWRDWVINAFNENMPYDQFPRASNWRAICCPTTPIAQLVASGLPAEQHGDARGGYDPRGESHRTTTPTG